MFYFIAGIIIGFALGIALHDHDCMKCLKAYSKQKGEE